MTARTFPDHLMSGYWRKDHSHFPLGISRYLWELFSSAHDDGRRVGFARYGLLIDRIESARFKGRLYVREYPVAVEERHEQYMKAQDAVSKKLWRMDRQEWPGKRRSLRQRLLILAKRDPTKMEGKALIDHLEELNRIFHEGVVQHFIQQPASMYPVGDWVRQTCEWANAPASEVVALLGGCCRESADFFQTIDAIVMALQVSGHARTVFRERRDASAEEWLRSVRDASPEVAERLDFYLREFGERIVTGFDLTDMTLHELPQFTVGLLVLRNSGQAAERTSYRSEGMAQLRQRIPEEKRQDFDRILEEARNTYGLNDDDVRITYLWPLGLIRKALRAAAARLCVNHLISHPDDVFQLTPDEVRSLMSGSNSPSFSEISERGREWAQWRLEDPPDSFGEPHQADCSGLPEACARMNSAIGFYIDQSETGQLQPGSSSWSMFVQGLAASPGCYEGRARVVRGPADFGKLNGGDVLVASTTSPAYNVMLPTIGAVVTDRGGTLCHAAIIAREFGIPAVIGASQATRRIPDGARVYVDGYRGFVAVREG